MSEKKLSVRDVATELQSRGFPISERTIREEIKAKRLRATMIRRNYYIDRKDLESYIRERETIPSDEDREVEAIGA